MIAFERLEQILRDGLEVLAVAREVPALKARVAELERKVAATDTGSNDAGAREAITADPSTWPRRTSKGNGTVPVPGHKEYDSDEVDLEIALAVLRTAPTTWEDVREAIARTRRLTPQQVAELKARITRQRLLAA